MAIATGSYGYVVVKAEWVLHEGIQMLLQLPRHDVAAARTSGYHLLEARILDDCSGSGLLAEVEIARPNGFGDTAKVVHAQVLIPWNKIDSVVCFNRDDMSDVRRGIGFKADKT